MMREKMDVALRILTAVHEHTDPIRSDIESLQKWVGPLDRAATPDELACIVILAELERRKNSRTMHENSDSATALSA